MTSYALINELTQFILKESRYCDESRYSDWESLWTDDGHYWVPRGPNMDSEKHVSHLNDNRARIHTRVKALNSGTRHSQLPVSPMSRVISPVELEAEEGDEYRVGVNFNLVEMAIQSTHDMHIWAGRITYQLRREGGDLKMARKKVVLVNGNEPIPNISFLI